ncbi:MAG: DUF3343 domain-containing protein [Bacillota bacterium]
MAYFILVFDSSHHAILAETVLRAEGLSVTLIPTPPTYSSGCGLSLKIREEDMDLVGRLTEARGIRVSGCHRWDR